MCVLNSILNSSLTFFSPLSRIVVISSSVSSLSLEANTCVAPCRIICSISSLASLLDCWSMSLPKITRNVFKVRIWEIYQDHASSGFVFYFTDRTRKEKQNNHTEKKYILLEMRINGSQELWGKLKKQFGLKP